MKTAVIRSRAEGPLAKDFLKQCSRLRIGQSEAIRCAIRLWLVEAKKVPTPAPLPWAGPEEKSK
ncbi:MAG: hypothetical protein BWY57_03258 [Betaproteobacteria bacterium ADurb.Bin341]|nr:MAG: hypothetical protein BWY57_03258 [Betaproteobacteria bacterium ADurb.Bin341]